jgi:nitrogen fixation NifU-like protein
VAAQLDQLYQQVILDHYREKHGHGLRGPHATPDRLAVTEAGVTWAESRQVNPLCGDEVTVRVAVDGTGLVHDVAWAGEGCSISQASTSVLHDLVVEGPVVEARRRVDAFRAMVRSRGTVEPDEDLLGDGVAFAGVGRHANRVKCAMLGWTAFEDALSRADAATAQEQERS